MAIKLVVAVTDESWFRQLRDQERLSEVNFWSPSPKNFRALQPGEFFLFKLHHPHNVIVGGGIFTHQTLIPFSLAWEFFGEANGARSESEMRARILKYRRSSEDARSDFTIGCRVLSEPFFFESSQYIPVPASWKPNIVSYKTFDTNDSEGLRLWQNVVERLSLGPVQMLKGRGERYGKPQIIKPRLGQGGFRMSVADVYHRRCAITRERTLPALDAAHIRPYKLGGAHELANGVLLRSDVHSLFDKGYVTITPDLRVEVSGRVKEEFGNGKDYYALHGESISAPQKAEWQPDREALRWHNENCFRA